MSTENTLPVNVSDPSVIILAARQLLSQLPSSNASIPTREAYKRELHRLIAKSKARTPDQLFAAVCDTRSKRTYYRRIASVRHGLRNMIEEALQQERIGILEFSIGLHAKLHEHQGECPITDPKPRHSKRQDLRGLPENWREAMYCDLQKRDNQFQLAYLVAAVSGCRPEELRAGISIVVTETVLTVKILHGAKVKESQGQPCREIVYIMDSDTHHLVQTLHKEIFCKSFVHNDFGEIGVKIEKKSGFTSALRRTGRRLWPSRHSEITPYCLRHAAASDWKACLPEDDVSAALGHFAPDTKRLYGQCQMSKGGALRPASVRADRSVKPRSKAALFSSPRHHP
jgi:integrase